MFCIRVSAVRENSAFSDAHGSMDRAPRNARLEELNNRSTDEIIEWRILTFKEQKTRWNEKNNGLRMATNERDQQAENPIAVDWMGSQAIQSNLVRVLWKHMNLI